MSSSHPNFIAFDWNGTLVPFFGLDPYPGVLNALSNLRKHSMPIFVVSRATTLEIEADVKRVGFEFDGVYGCTDKITVLSNLRVQYGRGVYVGDLDADARAAFAADLDFVHARFDIVASSSSQYPNQIFSYDELETVLLALNRHNG